MTHQLIFRLDYLLLGRKTGRMHGGKNNALLQGVFSEIKAVRSLKSRNVPTPRVCRLAGHWQIGCKKNKNEFMSIFSPVASMKPLCRVFVCT